MMTETLIPFFSPSERFRVMLILVISIIGVCVKICLISLPVSLLLYNPGITMLRRYRQSLRGITRGHASVTQRARTNP